MDILSIAEQNFPITFGIVLAIGLLQGAIMGRGIRNRFPSFKKHARIASLSFLILFTINGISNIYKFAYPAKMSLTEFILPDTTDKVILLLYDVLGINSGLGAITATAISIILILFLRFAEIHQIAKYFMFALSMIVLSVALLGRFTEYVPTAFQIMIYAFYQFGITIGIFFVTRRKEYDAFSEIE